MNWLELLFLHWPVPAEQLRRLIPEALQVDTFEGNGWLSIVPFRMTGVAPKNFPAIPGVSAFPELNVRTYVSDGKRPGVWFFSLDATSRLAVRAARWLFHLPYMDAKINFRRLPDQRDWVGYRSQRIHRNEASAELDLEYRPTGEPRTTQPGTLEHWLTARFIMYMANGKGQLFDGEVDHAPWKLQDAEYIIKKNSMTDWLGIKTGCKPQLVHYSDSLSVVAWSKRPCLASK